MAQAAGRGSRGSPRRRSTRRPSRRWSGLTMASGPSPDVVDEHALLDTHLGRGQTGTLGARTWSRPCRRPGGPASRRPRRPRGPPASTPGRRRPGWSTSDMPPVYGSPPDRDARTRRRRSGVDRVDLHPQTLGGPGHRGQPVAQRAVVGCPDHPAVGVGRDGRRPATDGQVARRRPGRPARGARPAPRRAGGPSIRRTARSGSARSAGSPCTAARSTSWSGTRVWTEQSAAARRGHRPAGPPGPAGPASPRPRRSVAASRCWSKSRKATTSARGTRWSAASVPTTNRAADRPARSERSDVPVTSLGLAPRSGPRAPRWPGSPRSGGPSGAWRRTRRTPRAAAHRTAGSADPTPRLVLGHGSTAPGAPGQRAAVRRRPAAGPVRSG